jgi:anti-sigma factor ChrR (cupin superfamily)
MTMDTTNLNGDLSRRISVDTTQMSWSPSPSGTVWRKRLHRVGPPEAGQVTSVVRYEPNSSFPSHEHPDGEEILVLEGTFSDEQGDWPAGTYLLNPEGFRHAPFSVDGCVLFVKLRQYPGRDRAHVALSTDDSPWLATADPAVQTKMLYSQPGFSDTTRLERWAPGTHRGRLACPDGAEFFVLDGAFEESGERFAAGAWLRVPAGAALAPQSRDGCKLYIKEGGLAYLKSG